jgi:GT2 family glycosyltransferase
VVNPHNLGFAAACNQGAAGSRADYLVFLNPDTRLDPEALATTLAFLDEPEQRTVGICGIRLVDHDGRPSTAAARFPSSRIFFGEATGLARILPRVFPRHLLTPLECASTRDVDQVIGACFVIRRSLYDALEGFDERFFVYFEEVDLSLRARQAGYRSAFFAGARAFHHGGLSSEQVKAARLFYSLRSRLLYAWKHFPRGQRYVVFAITFAIEGPARLLRAIPSGHRAIVETLRAYRRLLAFVTTPSWPAAREAQRRP